MCTLSRWPLDGSKESLRLMQYKAVMPVQSFYILNQIFFAAPTRILYLPLRQIVATSKQTRCAESFACYYMLTFIYLLKLVLPLE